MTVLTETCDVEYTADGATVTFVVPFQFQQTSDLRLVITDTGGNVTRPAFSTMGVNVPSGGSITVDVAPVAGSRVYVYRDLPLTQDTAFVDHQRFPAISVEKALDRGRMIEKRTRDIVTGSIHQSDADVDTDMALPVITQRANNLLGFDAVGRPTSVALSDVLPFLVPDQLSVSQFMRALSVIVPHALYSLITAISPDPDDPDKIVFETSRSVSPNGAFETMVVRLLSLTSSQITQVRNAAILLRS